MEILSQSEMEFNVVIKLTEVEARALNALTIYGHKSFLEVFYPKLGTSYLKPHEAGLISMFGKVSKEMPKHFKRIDDTRDTFKKKL